ncbi:MAG TPA: hypothetical protein VHY08_18245 [Bacillota bacterium]|nr:hypothetical protein [Bacillota bacterium]
MELSRVQLPITSTPITVYQYQAYILAVLLNYPECLPWFYSNYIQLEYLKDRDRILLDFTGGWFNDVPWISFHYFEKEDFIKNNQGSHQAIKRFLDEGWYLYSTFDEFYVPSRGMYHKKHSLYDFLLFGYDDGEQDYSILGYGNRGIFEAAPVSYSDFIKAFESALDEGMIFFFRKREDFSNDFDQKYLQDMLSDYFYGRDTSARLKFFQRGAIKDKVFGLNTYQCLIEYYQSMFDKHGMNDIKSSHRFLHALWEHKKCMLLRLEYLNQRWILKNKAAYFSGSYRKLENDALILRNTMLKFSLREDRRLLEIIINLLQEMWRLETKIVEELIQVLSFEF